jgi:hypothetical protein
VTHSDPAAPQRSLNGIAPGQTHSRELPEQRDVLMNAFTPQYHHSHTRKEEAMARKVPKRYRPGHYALRLEITVRVAGPAVTTALLLLLWQLAIL